MEISINRRVLFAVALIPCSLIGGYCLGQRRAQTNLKPTAPTKEAIKANTPLFEEGPTSDWIIYKRIYEGISLEMPRGAERLLWENVGHYSLTALLPSNTRLFISLRGKDQPLPGPYTNFKEDLRKDNLKVEETILNGRPAVDFTGYVTTEQVSYISPHCTGETHGAALELDQERFLVLTHTACSEFHQLYPERGKQDFSADDLVFKTVLSTLRFRN